MSGVGNDRRLGLPEPAKSGNPVKASDANKIREAILQNSLEMRSRTIRPGVDIGVRRGPGGTVLFLKRAAKRGGGGRGPCALGTMRKGEEDDVYLSPGFIDAAGLHESVGGAETTFTPEIGEVVWAEVVLTAEVEEDVLTGVYEASAPGLDSGESVPADHEWTPDEPAGKAYAPLGSWVSDGADPPAPVWSGYSCGNVHFRMCRLNTISALASYYRG